MILWLLALMKKLLSLHLWVEIDEPARSADLIFRCLICADGFLQFYRVLGGGRTLAAVAMRFRELSFSIFSTERRRTFIPG